MLFDVAQCSAGKRELDVKSSEVHFCSCSTTNSCITLAKSSGHLDYQVTAEDLSSPVMSSCCSLSSVVYHCE